MTRSRQVDAPSWPELAQAQHGMIGRAQLLELGLTPAQAGQNLRSGRWQTMLPGVYATFTGPVTPIARISAAVIYAGPGAVASHATALWLAGAVDELTLPLHVAIGHGRKVRAQRGVRVHRMNDLDREPDLMSHLATSPPRIRLEQAVLDHTATGTEVRAVDLVLRVINRRLTTAERVRGALARRARHRWRSVLLEVLDEARLGVASLLERRYLSDVERPHGLPAGRRNVQEIGANGAHCYRDVRYRGWRTVVELDGREAHPTDSAFRDLRRDNDSAVSGDTVLRYGWRDVVGNPCQVAQQVTAVLALQGWPGNLARCRPGCGVGGP